MRCAATAAASFRSSTGNCVGTGSRSVIADVVAGALGAPAELVRVEIGDNGTKHGPYSGGSRTTASIGPAAHDAARRLRAKLPRIASDAA